MKKIKRSGALLMTLALICPAVLPVVEVVAADSDATSTSVSQTVSTEMGSKEKASSEGETGESKVEESTTDSTKKGEKSDTIPIQLLGVNDFHGALDTTGTAYLEDMKVAGAGKAANLATHLNRAQVNFKSESDSDNTVRLQAGDLVGASPANSALLRDEPTMRAFSAMNFTVGTLGNHEFDKGLKEYKRILDGRKPTKTELGLKEDDDSAYWKMMSEYPREKSTQEIVVANIENKETGESGVKGEIPYGLQPYTIKEYKKDDKAVKVAYLGVVTREFPNLVLAQHTQNYNVIDEAEAIAKYTKKLREEEHVNAIVIVSHVAATSQKEVVNGEVAEMIEKVDKLDPENSVDVVFAGHNHQYTNGVIEREGKSDVRVVQSTSQGKGYIDLQGELDPETNDFVATPKAEVKATTELPVAEQDSEVKDIVDEASELIKPITEAAVAQADLDKVVKDDKGNLIISKQNNEHNESVLGNLITDAQLHMAKTSDLTDKSGKKVDVDFALTNNGGIRADLNVADKTGDITWGAVQQVQPFGNILQVVKISGADLKAALNEQYSNGKTGYFLQIAGLNYQYTGSATTGDFNVVDVTDANGNKIEDDKSYNIIINDFLFGGGDGFKSFTKGELVTAMDTDTDTFVEYFKDKAKAGEKIAGPDVGRKTLFTEDAPKLEDVTAVDTPQLGDKKVSGITLPGTTVTVFQEADKVLGTTTSKDDGTFELVFKEGLKSGDVNINLKKDDAELTVTYTIRTPQGPYIKDGSYVTIAKKGYNTWSNFNWKKRDTSTKLFEQTFQAKGRYEHENGSVYYSLYDNAGKWQGYINSNAVKVGNGKQGAYISDGRYVSISKKGYSIWSSFGWKERAKTDKLKGEIYQAKGHYNHINGATYYSLYDNAGKWHGYLNSNATKVIKEPQGKYIKDGSYVTISKEGYNTWTNFDWKKRNESTKLMGETYQAKGRYKHANGATYYSLYDVKGKWHGYINANAVKVGKGEQGAYISDGRMVKIDKKGYKVWSNFNWKKRNTTDKLHGQTFQAKGRYKHMNGSTYYSLYDSKGNWQGYVNANAVK